MALQGPIPVDFAQVFPRGVYAAGPFGAVRDFEASKGDRFVQSKDKATGLPLWVAEVIDGDPAARDKTAKVKVAAGTQGRRLLTSRDQPFVLPAPRSGDAVHVRAQFAGLMVTPYARSSRAAGVLAQGGRSARRGSGPWRPRWSGRGEGRRSMSGATGGSFGSASMHAGPDSWALCHTYGGTSLPSLYVHAGRMPA